MAHSIYLWDKFSRGLSGLVVNPKVIGVADLYAIDNFSPSLVFDFAEEFYRTGGSTTAFDAAMTHSRSGNATMVDSDGLLKWAPHNLIDGGDFSTGWVLADVTKSGNVFTVTTADTTFKVVYRSASGIDTSFRRGVVVSDASGISHVFVGNESANDGVWFNIENGTKGTELLGATGSITPLGGGAYYLETSGHTNFAIFFSDRENITWASAATATETINLSEARIYRSDLGGMVDNPDTGNSYVPTTSAARYLPRRGHHVYNGSAWVNEGVLHESEARTNLVTYSQDFTNAAWSKDNVTFTATTETSDPSGNNEAYIFDPSQVPLTAYSIFNGPSTSGTLSVFFKGGTERYAIIARGLYASGDYAIFDLQEGLVTQQPTYSGSTADLVDCGNGWWRCWINSAQVTTVNAFSVSGAATGTATASSGYVYIYGAQLEAASTPSSYIPTSGSTVTRSADTITVPYANLPWPTPNVIGEELVTNGTFDTDTSGWTARNAAISQVDGALRVDDSANAGGNSAGVQTLTTQVGKTYLLSFDVVSTTGTAAVLVFTNSWVSGGAGGIATLGGLGAGNYNLVFTAINTSHDLALIVSGTSRSDFDNISVREIDPLSVSIQMDGTATGNSYTPTRWYLDANNAILQDIGSTDFTFTQEAAGVVDTVTGGSFTSGVNTPFNIASRHGSTFINGSVDGTALTANTTPTALPDLSSTDLNLAFDYMGTVKTFRVWSDDLGDSGIALASATTPVITGIPTIGVS